MTGRAGLLIAAAGLATFLAFAKKAGAVEYEIVAERSSGALLREDQPNSRRMRGNGEEPFVSREDCMQAIRGVQLDAKLRPQSGWRLRCRPVDVPIERVVVR